MDRNDLMQMAEYAAMITDAAQRHETALRRAVDQWDTLPDHSDYAVIGESFEPLSQAIANWRGLMSRLFPTPAEDPADLAELAMILDSWK